MKMFKIIRNVDDKHRNELNEYVTRHKTKEFPNFSVVVSTHTKLQIGTYFILKNEDDGSFWYGEWTSPTNIYSNGSSYVIRKIHNISEFLKETCHITVRSESIFNSDFYYRIEISNYNNGRLGILEHDRYTIYKFPTSECLRYWLPSTSISDVEKDDKFLTDLFMLNKDSDAYKSSKKKNYDWFKNHDLDSIPIKRDIKLNSILHGII